VSEALALLNSRWTPYERHLRLATAEAGGYALTEDLHANMDLPPFARSSMDGYAIVAADSYGASENSVQYLTMVGQIAMGEAALQTLSRGQALQIATGGMLPLGADAVIMLEYTELLGNQLLLQRAVASGENVVQQGEDVQAGDRVLPGGRLLSEADLAIAASLGYAELLCAARPRVAIFSTGDELLQPGDEYRPAMIYDSNGTMLQAMCQRLGIAADFKGSLPDKPQALQRALQETLPHYDLLILSGGTSVGGRDYTAAEIAACGSPGVLVHGLNIKPGKPTLIAVLEDKPIFGLSGNPVTAAITFQLLVEPTLARWSSVKPLERPKIQALLTRNLPSPGGMVSYVRCRLTSSEIGGEKVFLAHPLLGGSGIIHTLAFADALLAIAANAEGLRENTYVEVELLRP